jgi:hypothetical protein
LPIPSERLSTFADIVLKDLEKLLAEKRAKEKAREGGLRAKGPSRRNRASGVHGRNRGPIGEWPLSQAAHPAHAPKRP